MRYCTRSRQRRQCDQDEEHQGAQRGCLKQRVSMCGILELVTVAWGKKCTEKSPPRLVWCGNTISIDIARGRDCLDITSPHHHKQLHLRIPSTGARRECARQTTVHRMTSKESHRSFAVGWELFEHACDHRQHHQQHQHQHNIINNTNYVGGTLTP